MKSTASNGGASKPVTEEKAASPKVQSSDTIPTAKVDDDERDLDTIIAKYLNTLDLYAQSQAKSGSEFSKVWLVEV